MKTIYQIKHSCAENHHSYVENIGKIKEIYLKKPMRYTQHPPPADTENKGNGKIDRIIMENNRNKAQWIYQFPKLSRQHIVMYVLCV